MTELQREREDKYDVDPTFVVPDLAALLPPGGSVDTTTVRLRSTYFDTEHRTLLAHRVTLRRRTGDADTGWQLKVPDGDARTEIRLGVDAADGSDTVPSELAGLVAGLALGQPLHTVAILDVTRRAHRLLDADGQLLAEVADDDVHASVPGPTATVLRWREVEVELGTDEDEKLLRKLGKRLVAAGAAHSTSRSKLARALAGGGTGEQAARPLRRPGRRRGAVARDVVSAYVADQVEALAAGDLDLRRGRDPIHDTRVATRRLRSTLRVFGDLFDAAAAAALDAELAWYAGLLGEVRDRQVARVRFSAAIAATPTELVLGPVAAHIEQTLLREQLHHDGVLHEQITGDRYYAMLATASSWVDAAPFTDHADTDAERLLGYARKAHGKAARRLATALTTTEPQHRAEALHRARKAVKRARYAAELAAPVTDPHSAKTTVKALKKAQEVLGEHHDSVVAAGLLLRLGAAAGTAPGENGFTYGLLYAREQQAADHAVYAAAELRLR